MSVPNYDRVCVCTSTCCVGAATSFQWNNVVVCIRTAHHTHTGMARANYIERNTWNSNEYIFIVKFFFAFKTNNKFHTTYQLIRLRSNVQCMQSLFSVYNLYIQHMRSSFTGLEVNLSNILWRKIDKTVTLCGQSSSAGRPAGCPAAQKQSFGNWVRTSNECHCMRQSFVFRLQQRIDKKKT